MINFESIQKIISFSLFKKPFAVLGLYFLVIIVFAFLYWYLDAPFKQGGKLIQLCFLDSLYFSTVTITTLGYGDISPVDGWGKLLTGSEAVFGILILGLYLNSLSHNLAIRYQATLKEKESEIAIKLIYGPNWYEINQYHWHLSDAKKALEKVHLLKQQADDCSSEELVLFKDSVKEFNNIINAHNLKELLGDKEKSLDQLNKLFGMIDPVKYQVLLFQINTIKSKQMHVLTKRFMENIKDELNYYDKSNSSLSVASANLQHITEWLNPELVSMTYVLKVLNEVSGIKTNKNRNYSAYFKQFN